MTILAFAAGAAAGYAAATYRLLRRHADNGCGCVDHARHADCVAACPCVYWPAQVGVERQRVLTAEERDHGGRRGFADAS